MAIATSHEKKKGAEEIFCALEDNGLITYAFDA